ncbi:MAG: NusA-like transcription termination signal-binding factor [Candidatus Woesearchaeota archaeon]
MKIKYDNEVIKIMNIFNYVTKINLKDYFVDDNQISVFVVKDFHLSKAVGIKGANVRLIENKINRKIKILGFNPKVLQFVKNLIYPLKVKEIRQEENKIIIESSDSKSRGLLIGKNAKNLRNFEKITKRYFDIDEIKII